MSAAGVFFYATSTSRFLYLLRTDTRNPGTWGVPGGKIEAGESLYDGIRRECIEEIGFFSDQLKLIPIQRFINKSFHYHTFFCEVADEFVPVLNHEHCGYAWVGDFQYPKPLHPGVFNTINLDTVIQKLQVLTAPKGKRPEAALQRIAN